MRGMRYGMLLLLVLAGGMPAGAAPAAGSARADLYVAPGGRDNNPGTFQQPLATLAGARDRVRQLVAAGLKADVRVLFRDGYYPVSAPVVFGPADSAGERFSITYAAYPGETPVFTGGRRIIGWQRAEGKLWKAEIPEARGGRWVFRRLYVNGQRRTLARRPNEGEYFRIQGADAWDVSKNTFEFEPGDIKNWPAVKDANAVVLINWETGHLPIASVDEKENVVTFTGSMAAKHLHFRSNQRYFVEGLREALDVPGEWHLDRQTGTLTYYPLPGEDMARSVVVAPVATQLLRIEGDEKTSQWVRGLRFEGLQFRYTDYTLPPTGYSDYQAAQRVPAVITLIGARDCAFEKCEIANLGGYALEVAKGCSGTRIVQNEIRDLGAGGVIVRQGSDHTTIHNNFIHDGGSVFMGAIPVIVQASSDNTVTHNEICDFNYTGISVGWSWGFHPTPCERNKIEYNHIHHVGRGVLTDLGGIYTLGLSPGTTLRHNHIHHVWDWPEGYLGCGIYPDEGSTGLLIENNLVYETAHGGVHVHYGRDNIFRNNIFAFGRDAQVQMGRNVSNDPGDQRKWKGFTESSMTLEGNIILYEQGDLFRRQSQITADRNLYWNMSGAQPEFPGRLSLKEWQAKGNDTRSLVADPKFVNAKGFDFRLQEDSPAKAIGFQQFDASEAGLTGDPQWVNRAKQIRRPETRVPERVSRTVTEIVDDFEKTRPGRAPRLAQVNGEEKGASIRVSEEQAAGGVRSLKLTDAPGMTHGYDPHMAYIVEAAEGVARASFDVRHEAGATSYHEWRDWSTAPFIVGPSITFLPDGRLEANKKPLTKVPQGQWVRVEITCPLGAGAKGRYDLTITVPSQAPQVFRGLGCDPRFNKLTWFGFSSIATDARAVYLDNLKLHWK